MKQLSQKIKLLLAIILAGIGTALTYHLFENAVHKSIDLIWHDWFDTDAKRWLVIPLTLLISLLFFGAQHYLDKRSETKEEHGLGAMPDPTVKNFAKILFIGYFSLVAGASLGPEAVLVPACMLLGAFIGSKLFAKKELTALLAAAGLMALFTAFFHSIFVGVLSLALVSKQSKTKITPLLIAVSVLASVSSYYTLKLVSGSAYLAMPAYSWSLNLETIVFSLFLAVAGYFLILGMDASHKQFMKLRKLLNKRPWWQHALVAASVIAALYLLGGPLVEFTGNQSIEPMFQQASSIGLIGLAWILIVKVALISWSKAGGYRGGMIFPTIFLAAVLVAMPQLYDQNLNLIYGMIAVLVGAFAANRKSHILV